MDKILAKKIADDSIKALESVATKYGLKVKYHGGNFSSFDFKPKIIFEVPITQSENSKTLSDSDVKFGFAPRGTKIIIDHSKEKAVVTGTRRTKYVIEMNGKEYLMPFRGCSLDTK